MAQQELWNWDVFLPITFPRVRKNTYAISKTGIIKECTNGRIVKENADNKGFAIVPLLNWDDYLNEYEVFMVDELVAWEFVSENREFGNYVLHIDGDCSNNYYKNLLWTSWDLDPDLMAEVIVAKGETDFNKYYKTRSIFA